MTSPRGPQGLVWVTFASLPGPADCTGSQTVRDNGALSRRAGAWPAAHPEAVTASPTPPGRQPLSGGGGRAAAEGILTGRWHLHSRLAAGRHWPALFPEVPGRAHGPGRGAARGPGCRRAGQTKERGAEPEAAGGETLTVGEKYRGEVGGRGCRVCLPGTATAPHFGHPRRV